MTKKFLIFLTFSILIGSIYIYPDIRFILGSGDNFKGITMTATPDEAYYLARLDAVYKGDYHLADIGLYEHRNDPWLLPPYFDLLIGLTAKTLRIPVVYLDITLSFILPVLVFWLIFLLASRLCDSPRWGILTALSIILGYTLFTFNPALIRSIFFAPYQTTGLWFLRPFSPQLIYIPFVFSLFAIYLFVDAKQTGKVLIIASAVGALNYLHIHLWAFIYAGLFIWLLISIFKKDRLLIKNILLIFSASFILAIPFWINYLKVAQNPNYSFLELIFGTIYTHKPIIPFSYIALSLFTLYLNKGSNPKRFLFLLSFLTAGLLCLNQQILTGKIIEAVHWVSYTNKTFLLIALIAGGARMAPRNLPRKAKKTIFYLAVLFLFFTGFTQQNNYYNAHKDEFQKMQDLCGAMHWLNSNTEKDDVILTESVGYPRSASVRIWMLYTHNYYYLGWEAHSLVSEEGAHYRLLAAMRFFRYPKKEVYKIIESMGGMNFACMSGFSGVLKDKQAYLKNIKIKYDNLVAEDALSLIKRYKVDYLLLEREDRSFANNIEGLYPVDKVFDDGFCKIYKFR